MKELDTGNFQKIARAMSDKYDVKVIPTGLRFQTSGDVINFPVNADFLSDFSKKAIHGILDHEVLHIIEERVHSNNGKITPIQILNSIDCKKEKRLCNTFEDIRIENKYSVKYVGVKENLQELLRYGTELFKSNFLKGKTNFWDIVNKSIILRAKGLNTDFLGIEYNEVLDCVQSEIEESSRCVWGEDAHDLAIRVLEKIEDKVIELKDEGGEDEGGEDEGGEDEGGEDEGGELEKDKVLRMIEESEIEPAESDFYSDLRRIISDESLTEARDNERYIPNPNALRKDRWEKPGESLDVDAYAKSKELISSQLIGMRKNLINIVKSTSLSVIERGKRNGRLDKRSLHRIAFGRNNIYKAKISGEGINTAISVFIDMSGSMSSSETEGTRSYYAKLSAISLGETWNSLSIPFEMIGFWNDYWNKVTLVPGTHRIEPLVYVIFKDFKEDFSRCKYRLNNITGIGNNTDGEALMWVAKRLYKRPEKRKILLSLSDGEPLAAHPSSKLLGKHLRETVKMITSSGIEVFSVGMCTNSVKRFYNKETGASSISVYNMDNFATEVYKLMKSSLLNKKVKSK